MSNLATGKSGHRWSFTQLKELGVCTNGHDANVIYDTRTDVFYTLGIAAPGATGFTATSAGSGVVFGEVSYRVRWRNSYTGTMSLASPIVTFNANGDTVHLTIPTTTLPTGVTHWVIERTTNGGRDYYPVNRTYSSPNGTAVGTTTYDDNTSDSTLRQRDASLDNQGQPNPYRCCLTNAGRVFLFGGRRHKLDVGYTDTSTTATVAGSGGGLYIYGNSFVIGQDLSIDDDANGQMFRIDNRTNGAGSSSTITLNKAYSGTTSTRPSTITGARDFICWSEALEPEYYGTQETTGLLSNELRIGDDGEPLTAGVPLGPAGVLWCKPTHMYMHSYTTDPNPNHGGKVIPLPTRRGALGPMSARMIDGVIYGMDYMGVWRMSPGGLPEEIGGPLANEWQNTVLNFTNGDNWHIGWDAVKRWVYFFVTEDDDEFPKACWIWSAADEKWVNRKVWPWGVTCNTELPDKQGALRLVFANHDYTTQDGATNFVQSNVWMDNIGFSMGAPASTVPLNANVTSGTSTTITVSGATFPTSPTLAGVPVTKINKTTKARETNLISSNTSTVLTFAKAWTDTPTSGDAIEIAPIMAQYRTGRIAPGMPDRKTEFKTAYVWVKYKTACTPIYVLAFYNGSAVPDLDRVLDQELDGVSVHNGEFEARIDPTSTDATGAAVHMYEIPLNHKPATDLQLLFYSTQADAPWEILKIRVVGRVDTAETPARN